MSLSMHRLIPEDRPRLRTRLAIYAIALVAVPLGFAWGYLSKDWPVRHRLWALWLVALVPWAWAWLRYPLAWLITISVALAVGIGLLYGSGVLLNALAPPTQDWPLALRPQDQIVLPAEQRMRDVITVLAGGAVGCGVLLFATIIRRVMRR
jgi:MFS family permease